MNDSKRKYWIIVASKDHVEIGKSLGIAQASHGKPWALKKMNKDDKVLFYSSKLKADDKTPYQKFTAIGSVKDNEIYQVDLGKGFSPFRRRIIFDDCGEVSIIPIIEKLSFITDKKHWGYPFRFGFLEIPEKDFLIIENLMPKNNDD